MSAPLIWLIVRHAEAEIRRANVEDRIRQLTQRGKKQAREVALRLASSCHQLKFRPDVLISSPAPRALETAKIFAAVLDAPVAGIQLCEELYSGDSTLHLLQTLQDIARQAKPMIFGHNPQLEALVQHASGSSFPRLWKGSCIGLLANTPDALTTGRAQLVESTMLSPAQTEKQNVKKILQIRCQWAVQRTLRESGRHLDTDRRLSFEKKFDRLLHRFLKSSV